MGCVWNSSGSSEAYANVMNMTSHFFNNTVKTLASKLRGKCIELESFQSTSARPDMCRVLVRRAQDIEQTLINQNSKKFGKDMSSDKPSGLSEPVQKKQ